MKHCAATLTFVARLAALCFAGYRLRAQDQSTQSEAPPPDQSQVAYAPLSEEQLDRLVAPIALYPDALVAQVLAASTFPSQIEDACDPRSAETTFRWSGLRYVRT